MLPRQVCKLSEVLDQQRDAIKTSDMARTLKEHITRYQSAYATFRLLGLTGDRFQLDHKACFIPRKTISAKAQNEKQQGEPDEDAEIREVDPARRDSDLIRQLHKGKGQRFFITGEGGMGKTEFTRHVALELANQVELQNPFAVPWRFELKELNGAFENSQRFVEQQLSPHDHQWLLPLARSGKVVFIFDGLDELGDHRKSFLPVLRDLIELFPESSFVLAGRPGSLGDLPGFSDKDRHTLQPLTMPEIRRYVLGVFGQNPGTVPLGQQLMKEIESKRSSLFPIIRQPLMLALACRVFSEPNQKTLRHELPANPAELVEQAIHNIFYRRDVEGKDHDRWLDALSTLAAFTLTESGDSVNLSTSREYAKRLLREHPPLRLTNDGEAQTLLHQLASACGVLEFENGQYTFTNRVLAEFLAARWIVRLGYPNWPYRERGDASIDSGKPYTTLQNERERQIMDFLGDHVWTINRSGLVQAIHFELGRTLWGGALLICQARWIFEQIKPFYSDNTINLDARVTLVIRVFRCLQAALTLSSADEALAHSVLKNLFSGQRDWFKSPFLRSALALIPTRYSDPYLKELRGALKTMGQKPKENRETIVELAQAIAAGWPGSDRAFASLDAALMIARDRPRENKTTIEVLARTMAAGWPGDDRAFASIDATLTVVRDQPDMNWIVIWVISEVMAASWPGSDRALASLDAALKIILDQANDVSVSIHPLADAMATGWPGDDRAFASLDAALTVVRDRPNAAGSTIGHISKAMARGWPGSDRAFASLDAALTIARNQSKENSLAIIGIAEAIATGWPGDDRAFTSLDAALTIARDDVNSEATEELAKSMATGWSGDKRAFASINAALRVARKRPKKNSDSICKFAVAMAACWPGNDVAFASMDAELTNALTWPKGNGFLIHAIAETMAAGWPGNDQALASLDAALAIVRDLPKENSIAIEGLAKAMARGWPGNERALASLDAALRIAREQPKENKDSICSLAVAMAAGWPRNDQAFAALHVALTITQDQSTENSITIRDLANAIATGWPGWPKAAQCITSAGEVEQLNNIEQWDRWVTVFADKAAIKDWCGKRGEKWGLEGDPEFAIIPIPGMTRKNGKQKAILIAPRERIRRGLDPALLSEIWQEQKSSNGISQGNNDAFEDDRAFADEICEKTRIAMSTHKDLSSRQRKTAVAWIIDAGNSTDLLKAIVEALNENCRPDQRIKLEQEGPGKHHYADRNRLEARLKDFSALCVIATRALKWRAKSPSRQAKELVGDAKHRVFICLACGHINAAHPGRRKGRMICPEDCNACTESLSSTVDEDRPEIFLVCSGEKCEPKKAFSLKAPEGGWTNPDRKGSKKKSPSCPFCRTLLKPFKR